MNIESAPATPAIIALTIISYAMCIAGAILLWRWEIGPAARNTPHLFRVRHIAASWPYFAIMCIFVMLSAFFAQALFVQICRWINPEMPLNTGFVMTAGTACLDLAAIAAVLYARRFLLTLENLPRIAVLAHAAPKPAPKIPPLQAILAGIGVFCVARTLFIPLAFLWDWILKLLRITAADQDLVALFRNETSVPRLAMMILVAVVIAPVTEEMVFRGGLFGYLRTRMQRPFALLLPAAIFALVHLNLRTFPLLLLFGIILSVAYERTGRLSVPMIAHALLNLSSIAAILLGVQS